MISWVMSSAAAIVDANSAECCVLRVRQIQLIRFKMLAEHKKPVLTGSRELCSQQWTVRSQLKEPEGLNSILLMAFSSEYILIKRFQRKMGLCASWTRC